MNIAYNKKRTFFHSIDPMSKFIWVFLLALWLYALREVIAVITVVTIICAFCAVGARLNIVKFLKISLLIFFASWILVLYQGIIRPGEGINIGFLHLSFFGMQLGLAIGLRTFGLVASTIAFSTTTSPQEFEVSLINTGMSYKIAHIFYLALRFLPVFEKDLQNIQDMSKLRGVKKISGLNDLRRRITIILIALIGTELRQADDTSLALETRGFGLYKTRTFLTEVKFGFRGLILVMVTIILMVLHLIYVYGS